MRSTTGPSDGTLPSTMETKDAIQGATNIYIIQQIRPAVLRIQDQNKNTKRLSLSPFPVPSPCSFRSSSLRTRCRPSRALPLTDGATRLIGTPTGHHPRRRLVLRLPITLLQVGHRLINFDRLVGSPTQGANFNGGDVR